MSRSEALGQNSSLCKTIIVQCFGPGFDDAYELSRCAHWEVRTAQVMDKEIMAPGSVPTMIARHASARMVFLLFEGPTRSRPGTFPALLLHFHLHRQGRLIHNARA